MKSLRDRGRHAATTALAIGLTLAVLPLWVTASDATEPGLISLHANNTQVSEILEILADRSGLNIVAGPAIQNQMISIRLQDTPFEEALNLVVRTMGLGYERVGNSILVTDIQSLAVKTGLIVRIFDLQFASATKVAEILEILSRDVSAEAKGNHVIFRGPQAAIQQAEVIVAQLDRKPGQVILEARLIEVNTTALLEAGIDWESITDWSTIITEGDHGASPKGTFPTEIAYGPVDDGVQLHRQLTAFELAVEALIADGNARLLSNTKVVTLDGEPAEIFAGDTVPVVISSVQSPQSAGASFQTVQVEKIDVGVRLAITPRISDDGTVTMLVEPEVSRIVGYVGQYEDLPQTSTRRARTLLRTGDGEKIYMGGLIIDEERETIRKVPLLGDIPVLGHLFRHVKRDVNRFDLVIEITPKIVGDMGSLLPVAPDILGGE